MGLFSKKRKDMTLRVYRTNQQTQMPAEEPEKNPEPLTAHDEEQVEGMC